LKRIVSPPRDWKTLLERAAGIVNSYDTLVTLRQLFYRLIAFSLLPNSTNAYKSLSHHTARARRKGTFPDLIDRGRIIHGDWCFNGIADALNWTANNFRLDRTIGQKYGIYLCVEKAGIIEQVAAWFGDYGFPVLALSGYSSQSFVNEVVRHVRDRHRPAVLIYAGDCDASGEDILDDFIERTACWDQVRHVALTEEQINAYPLDKQSGKAKDSRRKKFMERHHGEYFQVELDALPPEDLRALLDEAIRGSDAVRDSEDVSEGLMKFWKGSAPVEGVWDASAYDAIMAHEERERRRFRNQIAKWGKKK
jgi:hypothetical protein